MRRISTYLLISIFFFCGSAYSQPSCIVLGCADSYGPITVDASGPDIIATNFACYTGFPYKQVYWEYFYSPTSANFTQSFHQTSTGNDINFNYLIFDMGTLIPPTMTCPVDPSGWTQVVCGANDHGSADVGPGLFGESLTTQAGHFYAIAIIIWDGTDPSYTFTTSKPQLDGVNLTSANCNSFPPTCIPLGCAGNYGNITANTSGPDVTLPSFGCYSGFSHKVIYWQFFYATSSDVFTQTYHQTSTGSPINLNFMIFDMGVTAPTIKNCPIDPSGWTQVVCGANDHGSADVGPGLFGGDLTTQAGHYYAIAIILWDGTDPSYSFSVGTPQLGGVDLSSANCVDISLPVNLLSFTATVNSCTVELNWKSADESNFNNYELQCSSNGLNFNTIATIPVNTSNPNYSYQHMSPPAGKLYYRLKMVNIDGKIEYSKIISTNFSCVANRIAVYPNPVTDLLNINISNSENLVTTVKLFDSNGQLMYSAKMLNGSNKINMAKFAKGIYMLSISNASQKQNIKILK